MKTYKKILAVLIVAIAGLFIVGTQITTAQTTNDFSMGFMKGQQQATLDASTPQCPINAVNIKGEARDKADVHISADLNDNISESYVQGFRAGYEKKFLSSYENLCAG